MIVYILDIDGTLMPSNEVDNECYWQAVDTVYGPGVGTLGLDGFEHVTDAGILGQWVEERTGCTPTDGDTAQVKKRFLELLRHKSVSRPDAFQPLPGVSRWLEMIREDSGSLAAIATGGWSHTARFKLEVAGLACFGLPLASSDDEVSRTGIMRNALALLEAGTKDALSDITYVGDGPWDVHSALALGWKFIGIAARQRADALRRAGARSVFENFSSGLEVMPPAP